MNHQRIIVSLYGGRNALRVVEQECSEPKDGKVGANVLVAGVALPAVILRDGIHPETSLLPNT